MARSWGVGLSAVQLTGIPAASMASAVVGPMAANWNDGIYSYNRKVRYGISSDELLRYASSLPCGTVTAFHLTKAFIHFRLKNLSIKNHPSVEMG